MFLMVAMALMTGAATLVVLWPLGRRAAPEAAGTADLSFYRAQLAELDRDLARGAISSAEAGAIRTEAGRRLLRARAEEPTRPAATGEPALRRRRGAAALALSGVPLISLAVYGALGSPHVPSATSSIARNAAGNAELATALARIESHLAANPNDGRGWDVVAPVYLRAGRFAEAAAAFGTARRLLGDSEPRLSGLGEALVGQAGGMVNTEAVSALEKASALDPAAMRPRFYLAMAAEQDGRAAEAGQGYATILSASSGDAPWLPMVRDRLSRLTVASPAASPEIRAMVDGLDARLRTSGGTEEEWGRLLRSYVVLGQRAEAADRLTQARAALASDPATGGRLDVLARDLGLTAGSVRP